MDSKHRWLRTLLLFAFSPAVLAMIAAVVALRPLTAYQDGFHGPEEMWHDLLRWAYTGELFFPSWERATSGHLSRQRASYARKTATRV